MQPTVCPTGACNPIEIQEGSRITVEVCVVNAARSLGGVDTQLVAASEVEVIDLHDGVLCKAGIGFGVIQCEVEASALPAP